MMALMTATQAADVLGVKNRFTVLRLVKKGFLTPTTYTGARGQIALFDEEYLKQKAQELKGRAA